jgi:hypothetical protein
MDGSVGFPKPIIRTFCPYVVMMLNRNTKVRGSLVINVIKRIGVKRNIKVFK